MTVQPETAQPRRRQDDAVVVAFHETLDPGGHVAPQLHLLNVRTETGKERLATQTAGADPGLRWQVGKLGALAADESIARILALHSGGQCNAFLENRREVFETVDRDVDLLRKQCAIDFFREERATADRPQRHIGAHITLGLDVNQLDLGSAWLRGDEVGNVVGLPKGQSGGTCADAQSAGGASRAACARGSARA